jgi:3',5'-cyclic AMP phosphodiesterase CpdA
MIPTLRDVIRHEFYAKLKIYVKGTLKTIFSEKTQNSSAAHLPGIYHRYIFFGSILFLILTALIFGCTTPRRSENTGPLSFALIGNTCTDSPFDRPAPEMGKLLDALNRENPTFVIHTGNMVFGGYTVGIREVDLVRQFNQLRITLSSISRVFYFIPGEMDSRAGSVTAFESFTGKSAYRSFTYGSMLFIILNSTDGAPGLIGDAQWSWLEKTLKESEGDSIVILLHHPVIPQHGYDGPLLKDGKRLLKLLSTYPLRAIISGAGENFYRMDVDDVSHINAGSVPIMKKESADQFRYYIVTFADGFLTITGKKL